jgi:preprotein translocase subunit SecE
MTKHKKSRAERKEQKLLAKTLEAAGLKPKPKKPSEPRKPGRIAQFWTFLKEAKGELKWVTWPTRKETLHSTGVLLILVGVSAAYLGVVDSLLNRILRLIIN